MASEWPETSRASSVEENPKLNIPEIVESVSDSKPSLKNQFSTTVIDSSDLNVFNDGAETTVKEQEFTSSELRRLQKLRLKMDLRIIPCLWILYFLSCCLRFTVSLSFTMNTAQGHSLIQTLSGYSAHYLALGLALFYVGYIIFEVPSNLMMAFIEPRIWVSRIQLTIGVVGACHAVLGTKHGNAQSYVALRFFLGVAESGLWPGLAYYMSRWYRGKHLGKRIGWYYTAAQIAAAAVSLVSAGFQKMDGARGLYGYQWMFLIWGVVAIAQALSIPWWLPAVASKEHRKSLSSFIPLPKWMKTLSPQRIGFLTPADKSLHSRYIAEMNVGKRWQWSDLLKSCLDLRVWPFILMYFGIVGVGNGIFNYCTLIIEEINPSFSGIDISLLNAPIWLADALGIVTVMPLYDRFHKKFSFFTGSCLIIIAGLAVANYAPRAWSRYGGLLMIGFGLGPTVPICMAWCSASMAKTYGDVGVASSLALVTGLGNLGSVVTTYALYSGWPGDPTFRKSNDVCIALIGVSIIACGIEFLLDKTGFGQFNASFNNHDHEVEDEQEMTDIKPALPSSQQADA
ncbi:plasma membrane vitamin H transmembrane transporter Vht1 [Schizosaccharomyces pombe]|uniref:Vitamin H transporter 1 n=1 Tax=Schizosaccharomyces pombe (strain 972 / ATCC 24843) TaxID=284812 RepID=VHT1_SCHPO|nr:vitamin H transporter Vth1 [Schizosaccharomyces pombe]O13880.1 RecName: Full=Vitamin H transporter 1; AltName: Full=H(+)/biotin symporter vht1 [Schizosaccharomyces pombe 972h-]AAO22560.1 vitamin H transporter Vht1p [Schizosaccharomyces pombe]CAB11242.1 vitamin H transporter Vth1 [Schizosaccharomyces pombe]|eukprot:NP_594801.1 vitamin H transporter Vth1 [Schizosaccharomyces pombe]